MRSHPVRFIASLAVAAMLAVVLAAGARAASVPPEPFVRHNDYGGVRLSPSGRYLGALVPVRGRLVLGILDLDTNKSSIAAGMDDGDIYTFWWVNDNRLAFSIVDLQSGLGEQRGGGLFAVNRDGSDFRVLGRTLKQMAARGDVRARYTGMHSTLNDGSDDILVLNNDNNEHYLDIYRMDTKTGRKAPAYGVKPGDVTWWVADRNGAVRAAVATEEGGRLTRVFYRASADGNWEQLVQFHRGEAGFVPEAFDGDGTLIVASRKTKGGTAALYPYDAVKKRLGEPLASHPKADLSDRFVYDLRKKRIVGLAYDADRPGAVWFDDEWARLQATIDASLPGVRNVLQRGSERARVLVFSYSDTDPGSYYVYDPDKRRLELLAQVRKDIDPAKMPARTPVRYAARDGLEIPAYLTLPKGAEAKNLPLVLSVHGGPYLRGTHWAWDAQAAWLASSGYAVLQPEFRGSTGWGFKHYEAGWKQWGRAMQDDLDDGVAWLAKQGTIDPKRVCIMGASYGGYAVLMGLARDPDRWRCGVDIVGVTDISLLFDVTWSDSFNSDWLRFTAKDLIGDPDKDAALLKSVSPLENAARIKAPVLMAYGGSDLRVPLVHGEKMRDALRRNGVPIEWIVYPDEGHGFMQEKVNFDLYTRIGKFLDANIGSP